MRGFADARDGMDATWTIAPGQRSFGAELKQLAKLNEALQWASADAAAALLPILEWFTFRFAHCIGASKDQLVSAARDREASPGLW
jgi:hypothetical protein